MKYFCEICGMLISEKNFNCNKETFIERNTMENIIKCPFCGANKNYLLEKVENVNESTSKILDYAMKLEVFNGDFYREASLISRGFKFKKNV